MPLAVLVNNRTLATSPTPRGDGHRATLLPRDALIQLPYRLDRFKSPLWYRDRLPSHSPN